MATSLLKTPTEDGGGPQKSTVSPAEPKVTLLTGGFDKPYAFGLATAMAALGIGLDVIGSDDVDCPEMHTTPGLRFLNLFGSKGEAGLAAKMARVAIYYLRLLQYSVSAKPKLFHILWNNKFQVFDRTVLMLYYKALRKKIILTAHNVNAGERDGNDSALNRLTLRIQYRLADHIFVHTEQMKSELLQGFGVSDGAVTVIPFGINNSAPNTNLTGQEARQRLGLTRNSKTVLFFGGIRPYKGLEYLVDAFLQVAAGDPEYRLIIAGVPKAGCERYMEGIQDKIYSSAACSQVIERIEFIPDEETELYFKAADVLALPYTHVFQSGVLFLAYSFGLPVIATDVVSIREDMVEGRTGFLCGPRDEAALAVQIERYFGSELFRCLESRRAEIRSYADARHSWSVVATMTRSVYQSLLADPL